MGRERATSAIEPSKPKPILKTHKGAFNIRCVTKRDPDDVMNDIR